MGSPLLDPEVVAELESVGGSPGFIDALIESTVRDLRDACETLPSLVAQNPREAARTAHRLKSAAGTLGASRLHAALADLNDAVRSHDPQAAAPLREFVAAAEELMAWASTRHASVAC